MYDPTIGRFLSEDPSGFDGGDPNLFRYVGNDPINHTDPTGLVQAGNPVQSLTGFGNGTYNPFAQSLAGNLHLSTAPLPSFQSPIDEDIARQNILSMPMFGDALRASFLAMQSSSRPVVASALRQAPATQPAPNPGFLRRFGSATYGVFVAPLANGLSSAGNSIRGGANYVAGGIENLTATGNTGVLGTALAIYGGLEAHAARLVGGAAGGIVDVPGTARAVINDVGKTVDVYNEHGFATAVDRNIGFLQGAEVYYGTDILTHEAVDPWSKASEASGRFGGAAGTGAGIAAGLTSLIKSQVGRSAESIIAQVAQEQADKGLGHLGQFLSPEEQLAYAENPAAGSRFLGKAVHEATDTALEQEYGTRFQYNRVGPDFLDKWTGQYIELTTPGQVAKHMAKGGAYNDAAYSTYVLPEYP